MRVRGRRGEVDARVVDQVVVVVGVGRGRHAVGVVVAWGLLVRDNAVV
jgi:hypothetical protein